MKNGIIKQQKQFTNTPILLSQPPKPPMAPNLKQDSLNGQVNQNYTQHYTTPLTFQEGDKEDLFTDE